ncbi:hypothetical protein E0L36_02740 [Streptomyces sp. AJS327]|uniref:hypothetical protein n=1 Tax=Streptomyces sp. AJS327 TaxID=2545265 RepID=UPI0015DDDCF1|nr:hypothetical protein [Streptomyces sp. AJS327]MBA0049853.1 hypothetical protein [Streptomyces sp. AJS327]
MPSAGLTARRAVQLAALLALAVFYTAQLAGALLPNVPVFVTASLAGLALDIYLTHRQPGLLALLGKVRFDVTTRQLLRDMLIVIGLVRIPDVPPDIERPLTLLLLVAYGAHFLCQAVAQLVRRSRTLPVVTRNIDTSGLRLTKAPPRLLARQPSRRLLRFSIPGTLGLTLTAGLSVDVWGIVGVTITLLLSLGSAFYLGTWLLSGKRRVNDERVLAWLDSWLADYQPTVGMYFSGGTSSAYQANMWLSTLASVRGRPIVVLRERFMVQKIDATDVPVVCIPKVADLMRLEHSSVRVLLHPANSGKTSQVLRIPTIKHAFTNHGESDKLSSCNPYAKAYDEVWVAGPAARERYQLAEVGVADADVVEVGRPQLAPIERWSGAPTGEWLTVLYAPTWEGWDGKPGNTSIIEAGENIVARLLADERVRLVYKPHPMTGSVDPRAGAADARVRAMIAEANTRRAESAGAAAAAPAETGARALEQAEHELEALTAASFGRGADEMERMLTQGVPEHGRAQRVDAALRAWEDAFWGSLPAWEHQVVTGPRPGIYACFNRADVLVSDVSSVISDYLSSEKPYAVANTSGMSEEAFREVFPTVRAGVVVSPDAREIPGLLEAVRDPARDGFVEARAQLKTHLLGPSDPPSLARFDQAVQDLAAEAEARNARFERREAEIPGQRELDADTGEELESPVGDGEGLDPTASGAESEDAMTG